MYKHLTSNEMKKRLMLPKNYRVDACIAYGTYNKTQYNEEFLSLIKSKKYKREILKYDFLKDIVSVKINNKRIWFFVEYGSARLSEIFHFASLFGSKINVLIGSCGALKKDLDKFAVIIPTYSYSTESSAHMYLRNTKDNLFYPDKKLSKEIIKKLKETAKVVSGPIVTCQAMMGETWKDILDWSKKGFYGVEMESSTLFAVSKHFKVPAAAILGIADNLIEKEIVGDKSFQEKKERVRKIRNSLLKVVLETCLKKIS